MPDEESGVSRKARRRRLRIWVWGGFAVSLLIGAGVLVNMGILSADLDAGTDNDPTGAAETATRADVEAARLLAQKLCRQAERIDPTLISTVGLTGRTELSHADALFAQEDWPKALLKYNEAYRTSGAALKSAVKEKERRAKEDARRWQAAHDLAVVTYDMAADGGPKWTEAQKKAAEAAATLEAGDYEETRKLYDEAIGLLGAAEQAIKQAQASVSKPGKDARAAWLKALAAAHTEVRLKTHGGLEWLSVAHIVRNADSALRDGKIEDAIRLYAEARKALPDVVKAATPRMKARRARAEKVRNAWLATERLIPPIFVVKQYENKKWRTVLEHREAADAAMKEQDYTVAQERYVSADILLKLALTTTKKKGWTVSIRRTPVATSTGLKQREITYYRTPQNMEFVLIPAGEFVMGSPAAEVGRDTDEGPTHKVVVTQSFYMMTTEITQAQYEKLMGKTPAHFKAKQNPVEQVSWLESVEFCKALSRKAGFTYRLPTECEWEYACRAGAATAFYTGARLTSAQANIRGAQFRNKTMPVGSFPANAWGLRDMHGNVWEWCSDWYGVDSYGTSPEEDPCGPHTGKARVLRGGAWQSRADRTRCATRSRSLQADFDTLSGIRIVLPSVQADKHP